MPCGSCRVRENFHRPPKNIVLRCHRRAPVMHVNVDDLFEHAWQLECDYNRVVQYNDHVVDQLVTIISCLRLACVPLL